MTSPGKEKRFMIHLYSSETAKTFRKRAARFKTGALAASVLALVLCIFICYFVNIANADQLLFIVILLSTIGGWTAMLLVYLGYLPANAQYRHMEGVLKEEAEEFEGVLTLSKNTFKIPKSIEIQKVKIDSDTGSISLNVNALYAKKLPPSGARVRVNAGRSYILSFEVLK